MWHKGTVRAFLILLGLIAPWGFIQAQPRPDWRKVGPPAVELQLASPATGPVTGVWFSPEGSTLYARTKTGRVFQTADFEAWVPAEGAVPPALPQATAIRLPEEGARLVAAPDGITVFALKRNLYRSQDGGRSWENLTANRSMPVIGAGQHNVAVWPLDPDNIVVGNDYGVWRTTDGGLSWAGLNNSLANLPVRRILSTPSGAAGTRIQVENWGAFELPPGAPLWIPRPGPTVLEAEEAEKARYSRQLGAQITAVASAAEMIYAGATDGRIWFSDDGGETFDLSTLPPEVEGPVTRFYADPSQPFAALAALGGDGVHVLRTFNGGMFWDAIDSNLPPAPASAIVADRQAGAVYVGTSAGVYWASVDLLSSSAPPVWTDVSAGLPALQVNDLRLDPSGVQLYVAVEGYGVYATAAPHRRRNLRVISAADFSSRPAAPGSLLSVIGALVQTARAGDLEFPVLGVPTEAESQIQVPFGASGPTVSLALVTSSGPITLGLPVQSISPAIFVARDGSPMLYDADSGLPVDGRNPARSGGRLQIFATGLGKVQPEWPAGVPTPLEDPPEVTAKVEAFLDGAPLQVTRATLAPGYIGFYLVEVQMPVIANFGSSELQIRAGEQESNRVQLIIEP